MDEVWQVVERAIAVADIVQDKTPDRRATALVSLRRLAAELHSSLPEHDALRRLEEYIEEFEHKL
jgi:hypothetical protein